MPKLTQDRYSTLSYEEKRCQMLPSPSSSVPISLSLHHTLLFLQVHLQWSIFLFTSFNDSCFGVSRPLTLKANSERRERIRENEGRSDQKNKWAIIRVWTNARIRNTKDKKGKQYFYNSGKNMACRRNDEMYININSELFAGNGCWTPKYLPDMVGVTVIRQ